MKKFAILGLCLMAAIAFGQPAIQVTPLTVDYGDVEVGETTQVLITLQNVGSEWLYFNSITTDHEAFRSLITVEQPGSVALGNGDHVVEFGVLFEPQTVGEFSGTLYINTDDPQNPVVEVALSGTAIAPESNQSPREIKLPRPSTIVTSFDKSRNYPNPFNPSTNIEFELAEAAPVQLSIYNSIGREVATLVNETRAAGMHTVNWNASGLPSGVYFYELTSGDIKVTRKMLLTK